MNKFKESFIKSFDPKTTKFDNISEDDNIEEDELNFTHTTHLIPVILSRILSSINNNVEERVATISYNAFNKFPHMFYKEISKYYSDKNCNQNIDNSCCICKNNFEENKEVVILPKCNHIFDKECIKRWLTEQHHICPICRVDCN